MNCEEVCERVAADPARRPPEVEAHLAGCPSCAAQAEQMVALDAKLRRALAVAVPPAAAPAGGSEGDDAAVLPLRRSRARPSRSVLAAWAMAASVAAVVVVAGALWTAFPRESLAGAVVEHLAHEPYALDRGNPAVPDSAVAYVLGRSGVRLDGAAPDVTYAQSCWFRGRYVPHLVVGTASGPITVLVLPAEHVAEPSWFEEGGYRGLLVPATRGALAVLAAGGPADADLQLVADRVRSVLSYSRD